MRTISDNIRAVLQEKGLRAADLARLIPGVSRSIVGHWVTGKRKPLVENLRMIADALDVSVSRLIEDDPDYAQDGMEREALRLFRGLPKARQQALLALLKSEET